MAARVFLTLGALLPLLASAHFFRRLRHRRLLRVRHLQRRAARACARRTADSQRPVAGLDEPAVLGHAARRSAGRSHRAGGVHAAAACRRARSVRDRAAARRGPRRLRSGAAVRRRSDRRRARRAWRSPAPATSPASSNICRSCPRSCGCRSDCAARSRARWRTRHSRRAARRALLHGAVRSRLRPAGARRVSAVGCTSARWSTARSRCSARVTAERSSTRWRRWLVCSPGSASRRRSARRPARSCCCRCPALGSVSDRAGTLGWEWSTRLAYWPPNLLTFLIPYINGDISDNTYTGRPSSGKTTATSASRRSLLAIYGAVPRAAAAGGRVLDRDDDASPICSCWARRRRSISVAYLLIPGMKLFRFPTRFLIVVELGLALLGAIGLTRLARRSARHDGRDVARSACDRRWRSARRTAVDLCFHQPRQNPMVPAASGSRRRAPCAAVRADTPQPRTFTPRHRELHRPRLRPRAAGWTWRPYFELRDVLEPNTGGGFWNVPSADCYAGIAAALARRRVGRPQPRGIAGRILCSRRRLRSRHARASTRRSRQCCGPMA